MKSLKNSSILLIIVSVFISNIYFVNAQESISCPSPVPIINKSFLKAGFTKPKPARSIDTIFIMSTTSVGRNAYDKNQIISNYNKTKTGTHYLIDRVGRIYQLVADENIAHFSKVERMQDGRNGIENFSIGITLMQKKTDPITYGQYVSLDALIYRLSTNHPIENMVSHRGVTDSFEIGPYNFDWTTFKSNFDKNCISIFGEREAMFSCPVSDEVDNQNLRSTTENPMPLTYIAPNLVPMNPEYSEGRMFCIKEDTYKAYKEMREEAKKKGLLVNVNSAFRDVSKQQDLYVESKKLGLLNRVAEIGKSEHQLGTAFDFYSGTTPKKFSTTPEYVWLREHAWKYGFVETYRREAEGKLIQNEPWHWRYVGIAEAKKIFDNKLYVVSYLENL
jgi:LAS superfamily LD-carboxypeptidase LdcB